VGLRPAKEIVMAASDTAVANGGGGASQYLQLGKTAFSEWSEHKATKLAAALAFYTMLSIAPLLIISITIISKVPFLHLSAKDSINTYLTTSAGEKAAEAARTMIDNASKPGTGVMATVISTIILILSASGVFGELQDSMNTIFEVKPKPDRGILGMIKDRFFSMTLVMGTAFLLLVSMIASTVLTGMTKTIGGQGIIFEILNFVLSFAVTALLFSLMFKYLPDVRLHWRNVFIGGALTAVLFTIGKFLLGWYLGRASTTSIYGAAGSLVAMLLWVYYSAQILFFGAEFTRAYALAHGDGKQPEANALKVTEEDKAKQGRPSEQRVAAKAAQAGGRPVRTRVPSPSMPAYSMAPAGEARGALRQYALAGAGVVVGAIAGALGATAMAQESKRPTRKHLAAVRLDERLKNVEHRVGKVSRIHQYLEDATVYDRIREVEKRIRHARGVLRSEQNKRPNWLVRVGDAIAGNKN
jgi:membrane protein